MPATGLDGKATWRHFGGCRLRRPPDIEHCDLFMRRHYAAVVAVAKCLQWKDFRAKLQVLNHDADAKPRQDRFAQSFTSYSATGEVIFIAC